VAGEDAPSAKIDTSVPHSARIWNYWLGGKDNYPVDREAGDKYREAYPQIVDVARAGRYFLARAVRYLAGEAGVRQFIDVGTGLPAADNTHEVAQRVAPECRVVYVDNDPLVLAHAQALLTSSPEGACGYIGADMRDTERILAGAARTLDVSRPVAVLFIGVLGHVAGYEEARSVVTRLLGALPAGSYLAVKDSAGGQERRAANEEYERTGAVPYFSRTAEQIEGYFAGLDLVPPGVVPVANWRPDPSPFPPAQADSLAGVGRKPLQLLPLIGGQAVLLSQGIPLGGEGLLVACRLAVGSFGRLPEFVVGGLALLAAA
jgi:S-adenosyl methyltransferase